MPETLSQWLAALAALVSMVNVGTQTAFEAPWNGQRRVFVSLLHQQCSAASLLRQEAGTQDCLD